MSNEPKVQAIAKGTSAGKPAGVVNTLQTETLTVYLHLQWKDPEGTARDFPENFEITPILKFADGTTQVAPVQKVKKEGRVTFLLSPKQQGTPAAWTFEKLTLKFDSAKVRYLLCEKRGEAAKSCVLSDQSAAASAGPGTMDRPRAFALPPKWSIADSDWAVESTAEPKSWVDGEKEFQLIIDDKRHDVGKSDTPVKMTLDPHWQFLRWIYYDRWMKGDKRISIPHIWAEGFLDKTKTAGDPDTRSNWNHGGDADGKEAVQCLPWIIQKAGTPKPDADIMLRFKTRPKTFIHTKDDGTRLLVDGVSRVTPKVDRLRYYDLPEQWRSTKYYGRMTGPDKEDRFETIVTEQTKIDRPLTFSLDDIVLVDDKLKPVAWVPDDRASIISHLFNNLDPASGAAVADLSNTGVYKPDTAGDREYFTTKPDAAAIEKDRNYIADYPDWTRLVAAKGNLFDVFDRRTKESAPPVADEVIGARAAVRWVDATAKFAGINMFSWTAGTPGSWTHEADGLPVPGRMFDPKRPSRTDTPFFSIQPFFEQRTSVRYREAFNPANDESGGRFDMALLRCCDVVDDKEIAVNVHYFRFNFNFLSAPAIGNLPFENLIIKNVNNRWNGNDAPSNASRTHLVPQINKPLKVPVVWFGQALDEPLSHFKINVRAPAPGARDNRGAQLGTGESKTTSHAGATDGSGRFASAHETGHADSLPDEYNERWDGASYGQLSFKSNTPGDPYEPDGREIEYGENMSAMMNGNATMRNRYFWHSAEWVRRCCANLPFKVEHDTYPDYRVPQHEKASRSYVYWPIEHLRDFVPANVSPLKSTRGKCDLYLFTMGEDKYTVTSLPGKEVPAGATTYDGELMVIVKLKITLPLFPAPKVEEDERKAILQAIAGSMRNLNNKFYATGKVRDKTTQKWEFKRCLIHFSPRFLVENFIDPSVPSNPTFAADIDTKLKSQFEIVVTEVDPPVTEWEALPAVAELISAADWEAKIPAARQADVEIAAIKTDIAAYHAIDPVELIKRIKALDKLVGREKKFPKKEDAAILKAIKDLGTEATARKKYLEKTAGSRKLKLQYKDDASRAVDVADGFFKNFPSMLGIYKLPADIVEADLLPLVKKVIKSGAAVKAV